MKQEPHSIYDFRPGDIVTRIEPTAIINQSMFMGGLDYDCSYIGEKLVFLGIANGCAYFEPTYSFSYMLEKGNPISLPVYKFEHGWAHFIDPVTFIAIMAKTKYVSMSDVELLGKLDEALSTEDYEEASRIQHEMNNRKGKDSLLL